MTVLDACGHQSTGELEEPQISGTEDESKIGNGTSWRVLRRFVEFNRLPVRVWGVPTGRDSYLFSPPCTGRS